jgi:hypothetical protein
VGERLTLRPLEFAILLARGKSAVDVALEHGVANVANLVVGLDVLVDCLAAAR